MTPHDFNPAPPLGRWARFQRTHLHDYNRAAARFWFALAGVGALALVAAMARVVQLPAGALWQVLAGTAAVAIAAFYPIQIPRTKHSIAVGDIFVFLMLALHGTGAATLAAALEGLIGASRTTTRLTSRIATVAAASAGMAASGWLFAGSEAALVATGVPQAASHLSALVAAALLYVVFTTAPLMQVIHLKRGTSLRFADWWVGSSWVGAIYLGSAAIAGVMSINARQHGNGLVVVGLVIIGLMLALLRVYFNAQTQEHRMQEARIGAAEQDAAHNQQRFHAAFTQAAIGMAIVSAEGVVLLSLLI